MSNQRLASLVNKVGILDRDIKQMEERLNMMKARRHLLLTRDIPDVMTEMGARAHETDQFACSLQFHVEGSFPKDPIQRLIATNYIVEHGGGAILKTSVMANFPTSHVFDAEYALDMLREEFAGEANIDMNVDVNHGTLKKWAREMTANKQRIDYSKIGLRAFTVAKIKDITRE